MAGVVVRGPYKPPVPESGKKNTYPAAIQENAENYDELMQRYRNLLDENGGQGDPRLASLAAQYSNLGNEKYVPNDIKYNRGPEMNTAAANLRDLTETGGYSSQGISDLRSRGISPIRAVYANAQQDMARNRSIQGGYSPNFNAASAKLTRGLSDAISQGTQNVNAGIAQNVASNRLQAAPQYSQFAQNETAAMGGIDQQNESNRLEAAKLNNQNRLTSLTGLSSIYGQQAGNKASALAGMTNLYGTTPANAQLYGNQALATAGLQEQQAQRKQNASGALINAYGSGMSMPGIVRGGNAMPGARY